MHQKRDRWLEAACPQALALAAALTLPRGCVRNRLTRRSRGWLLLAATGRHNNALAKGLQAARPLVRESVSSLPVLHLSSWNAPLLLRASSLRPGPSQHGDEHFHVQMHILLRADKRDLAAAFKQSQPHPCRIRHALCPYATLSRIASCLAADSSGTVKLSAEPFLWHPCK
jgi:hypothetical protein